MKIENELLNRSLEEQKRAVERLDHDFELTKQHCLIVHVENSVMLSPDSYRSIDHPKYVEPTCDEIKTVIDHLAGIHSKTIVSKMLGLNVSNDPTRTINRWIKGDAKIPYAAWRMLLILDGRVVQVNRLPDANGVKHWQKFYP